VSQVAEVRHRHPDPSRDRPLGARGEVLPETLGAPVRRDRIVGPTSFFYLHCFHAANIIHFTPQCKRGAGPCSSGSGDNMTVHKRCTCGREFSRAEWAALGPKPQPEPGGARIELATCPSCGSTIAAGISPRWISEAAKRRADLVVDRSHSKRADIAPFLQLAALAVALIVVAVGVVSC